MKRILFQTLAWIAFAIGVVGVFVPVLPTTPLLLLATFLFAKSSPRCHAWILSTKVYRRYVLPFKEAGGIPASTKVRILTVSFVVMGISAYLVPRWYIWLVLGLVAAWLVYLMCLRIPTTSLEQVERQRSKEIE
ncbi:MAG: YbaN family protein [Raoultibacter sp.]